MAENVDWDLELEAYEKARAFSHAMDVAALNEDLDALLAMAREEQAASVEACEDRRVQRMEEWFALEADERDGE